jgi:hypothetical protein
MRFRRPASMFELSVTRKDAQSGGAGGGDDLGPLPAWDLSDLYTSTDAPELARDLDWYIGEAAAFSADYKGRVETLSADELLASIQRSEKMDMIAGRILSFAGLRYYQNSLDADRTKFMSDLQQKITDASSELVFYWLEMNRIEDARYAALLAENADLARYRPVLDHSRAMRPYQLSDEIETLLHDQSVVGASAWNKLFDETIAGLRFELDGEDMGMSKTARAAKPPRMRLAMFWAKTSRFSPVFTTHWPRKKKSRIAGASCLLPKPAAIWPTMLSPKSSRRCAMPSSPPTPNFRTAITRSRPNGSGLIKCKCGIAMRLCRWKTARSLAGIKRAKW